MLQQVENTTAVNAGAGLLNVSPDQSLNVKLQDVTGNRLLSRAEYCSMLGISDTTSERWSRIGHGPRPVKIGLRRVGYRLADVLAFIEARQSVAA